MAVYGAPNVGFVLLGGRSLAGYLTDIQDSSEIVVEETTPLGQAYDSWASVGVVKSAVKLLGIYNSTDFTTAVAVATTQPLMYCLEGNTIAKEFTGIDGVKGTVVLSATRDQLHRLEIDFKAETAMDKGVIVATHAARTSSSSATTTVDNSASSSAGAVGYLGMSALARGGYTNAIIKVRHSTNDSTWSDLITFTAVTAAPASERVAVTGTVNRYIQTTVTWTGSGSSESAT
jgi:hypothetical protein